MKMASLCEGNKLNRLYTNQYYHSFSDMLPSICLVLESIIPSGKLKCALGHCLDSL